MCACILIWFKCHRNVVSKKNMFAGKAFGSCWFGVGLCLSHFRKEMFATWNTETSWRIPVFFIQNSYSSCWFNLMSWRKRILLTCPSFTLFSDSCRGAKLKNIDHNPQDVKHLRSGMTSVTLNLSYFINGFQRLYHITCIHFISFDST